MTISAVSFYILITVQILKCLQMYFTLDEKSTFCMFIVHVQEAMVL